jgi:hypothetical protein
VRTPNPTNFYIPKIITNEDIHADSASDSETELLHRKFESNNTQGADSSSSVAVINKARERPKRQIRKPARFQSSFESTQSETDSNYYKIKRVIGRRNRENPEHLVQFKGESAQNAIWTKFDQLNPQAQTFVLDKVPPFVD